uniref:Uncharacterized protein n=1 Tax=Ditylum brightwellii TaxID=49249 RepID=A0A7S1YT41_9STRA|mmetsp:Transcript_17184/g.25552  ORF Transcript_17184/g.25552 Transcript_17184/m.25552 type:complete len:306 (+) Transcript_17184:89-1006(+)
MSRKALTVNIISSNKQLTRHDETNEKSYMNKLSTELLSPANTAATEESSVSSETPSTTTAENGKENDEPLFLSPPPTTTTSTTTSSSILATDDDGEHVTIECCIHQQPHHTKFSFDKTKNDDSCACSISIFSATKNEHMDFFLPKLGMACQCHETNDDDDEEEEEEDPTALRNILRTWQVNFLASLRITNANQFIIAYKKDPRALSKSLKQWRRINSNADSRTTIQPQQAAKITSKSCYNALYIWYKMSTIVLHSNNLLNGLKEHQIINDSDACTVPDTLTVPNLSDTFVSSDLRLVDDLEMIEI